ncbi:MAG: squalene/phytoene synthase family protein [Pseudomonadota bacterium]
MTFDTNLTACARIVERADPLRFACTMAVEPALRARLFPLYAFNVEVSRAPWVTAEPMIAEMRLQWWRDALEEIAAGGPVRAHEVTTPLAGVLSAEEAQALDRLVAARRWDIYKEPYEDQAHLHDYLDATAATLMVVAGRDARLRGTGYAGGVAAWFHAVPKLEGLGRIPLVNGTAQGVQAMAQDALGRLGPGGPAALPAAGARSVLRAAIKAPGLVGQGGLPPLDAPWARLRARLLGRV